MILLDLFDAALADRAEAKAFGEVTYAALDAGHRRVAARLSELGLRRGERLALFTENRVGFVFAYLAALRLGAIAVPTNVLYRAHDLSHVLEDAGAAFVVASQSTRELLEPLHGTLRTIDVDEIERWAVEVGAGPFVQHRAQPDDVAVILYTSGTTGRSKGAMLTHGNLAAIAAQVVASWRWTASDTLLIALPLFHMHGLGAALNGSLAAGARIVVHERFDADRVLAELRTGAYTMFFGVPTMYVRLLERAALQPPPPLLRLYVCGSAALTPEVHEAFLRRFGAQILERYGATEFGFALTNRYGGPRVAGSVGVPTPGTAVALVAPGGTERVAPGEVGELLVAGPTVFKGYWNAPSATAEAFADDAGSRWYRSGDLARYDQADDVYRIVGRSKELIISGGFNVYPREVEDEIERFAGVRACAVVGVPDAARGELPIAFLECDGTVDTDALLNELRKNLASFKVPKAVHVVDELPRNALGKIEKARLKSAPGAS